MNPISKQRALEIHNQTYEEAEEIPSIDDWVELPSGWMPLRRFYGAVIITWEVVLEHGRYYIQHLQDWTGTPVAERDKQMKEAVKLVGGSFPW